MCEREYVFGYEKKKSVRLSVTGAYGSRGLHFMHESITVPFNMIRMSNTTIFIFLLISGHSDGPAQIWTFFTQVQKQIIMISYGTKNTHTGCPKKNRTLIAPSIWGAYTPGV